MKDSDDTGDRRASERVGRLTRALDLRLRLASTLAARALTWVWSRPAVVLAILCAFNLYVARRTFRPGIWADNDSVSHYAYLRYLVEEFYPHTGTFLGWCPKFNLGLPYLLFNTPPLLYVVSGTLAATAGFSPLIALKLCMVAAFLAVPLATYAFVATFEDGPSDLPKFAAVSVSLFSSELFGLEYFFKNGMLNPAFALPFLIATLAAYRRAMVRPVSALRWAAVASVAFSLTLLTHTLSAYMASVALGCVAIGAPRRRWGANFLLVGLTIGLGLALSGFWLVPSMPFAAKTDAAYTWIRNPDWTLGHFFDGTLLSSYPVGFFPRFIVWSSAGVVALVAAAYGLVSSLRRRSYAVAGVAAVMAIALWITLGPVAAGPLAGAPMYDRLLWYRFLTLAELATLVIAAYGAWVFALNDARRFRTVALFLCGGAVWAASVVMGRAVKIKTASEYPEFEADLQDVATYLRQHGDHRYRVFSEFLGSNVVEATSVNAVRELIPVLTGFDEASGWIYENNPASQAMQKEGAYWYNSLAIIERAARYNVKYIVAGSPMLVKALSSDPRWQIARATSQLILFESRESPHFAEGEGVVGEVAEREYVRGGGYRIRVRFTRDPRATPHDADLLVKTNYSAPWRAESGGRALQTRSAPDGMLIVRVPSDLPSGDIELTWEIVASRARGNALTIGALLVVLLVFAFGDAALQRAPVAPWDRALRAAGPAGLVVLVVVGSVRARTVDLSRIGFGIAGGMIPVSSAATLRVGAYDDDVVERPNHVLPEAWSERELRDGLRGRDLTASDRAAAILTFSAAGENRLRIGGAVDSGATDLVEVDLEDPTDETIACRIEARLGEVTSLPAECVKQVGAPGWPGVRRRARIHARAHTIIGSIDVESPIRYVEAESLANVLDDGGTDAFYVMGSAEYQPQNGVSMAAIADSGAPVTLRGEIDLPPGTYDAWVLARVLHERYLNTRADIAIAVDGVRVGVADLDVRNLPFWDELVHFRWRRVGTFTRARAKRVEVTFERREKSLAAFADLDALAFVPTRLDASSSPSAAHVQRNAGKPH